MKRTELRGKHFEEIVNVRGIPEDWARANCSSITASEATEILAYGYEIPCGGILIQGEGHQQQYKPDRPFLSPMERDAKKKAPKYRTPAKQKGGGDPYDAILPSHPEDKTYWIDLEKLKGLAWKMDGEPYLLITEGGFKAMIACSIGIPTIGLCGVTMGLTPWRNDPHKRKYPIKSLKRFAEAGFNFIFAYDADAISNPNVRDAEHELKLELQKFGYRVETPGGDSAFIQTQVLSITGAWTVDEGKGIDDYIKKNGAEAFRLLLGEASANPQQDFESWIEAEAEAEAERRKKSRPPEVNAFVAQLTEKYRESLAWESKRKLWRQYGAEHKGCWSVQTEESVERFVCAELEKLDNSPSFNTGYALSVVRLLKPYLEVKEWNDRKDLIPLRDGVLSLEAKELLPHAPGYRFTWQLPLSWADQDKGCRPIKEFLVKISGGSKAIAEVLFCYSASQIGEIQ